MIKLEFTAIDGAHRTVNAKTAQGARKSIEHRLGKFFDIGSYYAISDDGVVKVVVSGDESIRSLYPERCLPPGDLGTGKMLPGTEGREFEP